MTERDWTAKLHQLPCVLCLHTGDRQTTRTTTHHVREGQGRGQRASAFLQVALCELHHQGTIGWHGLGKRAFYHRYKLDELDLLAMTLKAAL